MRFLNQMAEVFNPAPAKRTCLVIKMTSLASLFLLMNFKEHNMILKRQTMAPNGNLKPKSRGIGKLVTGDLRQCTKYRRYIDFPSIKIHYKRIYSSL